MTFPQTESNNCLPEVGAGNDPRILLQLRLHLPVTAHHNIKVIAHGEHRAHFVFCNILCLIQFDNNLDKSLYLSIVWCGGHGRSNLKIVQSPHFIASLNVALKYSEYRSPPQFIHMIGSKKRLFS